MATFDIVGWEWIEAWLYRFFDRRIVIFGWMFATSQSVSM
jgi:hypothetical protein